MHIDYRNFFSEIYSKMGSATTSMPNTFAVPEVGGI